jgi:hypothetical protein
MLLAISVIEVSNAAVLATSAESTTGLGSVGIADDPVCGAAAVEVALTAPVEFRFWTG